jgi:hypothetical protein
MRYGVVDAKVECLYTAGIFELIICGRINTGAFDIDDSTVEEVAGIEVMSKSPVP